jgi:DNA-binding transcriptional ArsR family regulator
MARDVCSTTYVNRERVSRVEKAMSSERTVTELAGIFKVLGDPTRVRILQALSLEELCVCDIASLLGMSQSAVSHQLRVLRSCRLVKFRKEGKMAYYSLDDDHVMRLFSEGLKHVTEG